MLLAWCGQPHGAPAFQLRRAGPDRAPQPLAATWLIAAIPDLGWVGPWREGLEGREGQLDSYKGVTLLQGPEPSAALSTGLLSLIDQDKRISYLLLLQGLSWVKNKMWS